MYAIKPFPKGVLPSHAKTIWQSQNEHLNSDDNGFIFSFSLVFPLTLKHGHIWASFSPINTDNRIILVNPSFAMPTPKPIFIKSLRSRFHLHVQRQIIKFPSTFGAMTI
jgi:hypothetical protein